MNNIDSPLAILEKKLRCGFQDKNKLLRAMCTSKVGATRAGIRGNPQDNSALAFLGEQTLKFLILSTYVETEHDVGVLMATVWRYTGRERLAEAGRRLELARWIKREPERASKIETDEYADAVAAIIGAAYLDGGMEAASHVVNAMDLWKKSSGPGGGLKVRFADDWSDENVREVPNSDLSSRGRPQ